ncbi:MAG TPA: response regulator transcription factor [Candidatus Dormibacteraeota bacterium]|nr:response regulator transcription factor [Candidatus Dormibacteraeota bacterium]
MITPRTEEARKLRLLRSRLRGAARVLVVGEPPIANVMKLALNHGRNVVRIATTIADADRVKREWHPHLVLVDIDLTNNAISLIGRREGGARTPSIAVTRRGDMRTKLQAFDRGADDFVTAPFSPEELIARVLAIMRRSYGERIPFFPTITIGDVEIDILHQHVRVGTARLRLTAIEQSLLYLLASNPGDVLTREMILDTVWGSDYVAESNIVDRHIRNLRIKLGDNYRRPRYIGTVPRRGYRFLLKPAMEPPDAVRAEKLTSVDDDTA